MVWHRPFSSLEPSAAALPPQQKFTVVVGDACSRVLEYTPFGRQVVSGSLELTDKTSSVPLSEDASDSFRPLCFVTTNGFLDFTQPARCVKSMLNLLLCNVHHSSGINRTDLLERAEDDFASEEMLGCMH